MVPVKVWRGECRNRRTAGHCAVPDFIMTATPALESRRAWLRTYRKDDFASTSSASIHRIHFPEAISRDLFRAIEKSAMRPRASLQRVKRQTLAPAARAMIAV